MIPIRNKKKSLQITVDEMRNFAFNYIEKYAPSKQQLKTYLLKKYLKLSSSNVKKQDIKNLIDIISNDLEKNKFINDQFYSDSKAKNMIRRGSSINKIRSYLFGKGIRDNLINAKLVYVSLLSDSIISSRYFLAKSKFLVSNSFLERINFVNVSYIDPPCFLNISSAIA